MRTRWIRQEQIHRVFNSNDTNEHYLTFWPLMYTSRLAHARTFSEKFSRPNQSLENERFDWHDRSIPVGQNWLSEPTETIVVENPQRRT